jgi:Uma2 family endonuclease
MSTLVDEIRLGESPELARMTLEQYHRMNEAGVFLDGSPIELIDGVLVRKDRRDAGGDLMTHGTRHAAAIAHLHRVLEPLVRPRGFHIRTQFPVSLPPDSEPEPDVAVVSGAIEEYVDRHPGPAEVSLVCEIAFSSLPQDRKTKLRLYAGAGIVHYWIVNLRAGLIETYSQPDTAASIYRQSAKLGPDEVISLPLFEQTVNVTVSDLLI